MDKLLGTHRGPTRYVYFILAIAAIGGILYGYDIGIITGALLFMRGELSLSVQEISFIGSAVLGGGAFATLFTGPLADKFGRRQMLVAAAILFLIGVLIVSFAHSYANVLIGRLVQGIGVGIITIATPLYIAEVMPSHFRGRGLATFQLMLTAGILFAGFIGVYFTRHGGNWRAMFLTALVPGILLLVGSFFMPASPRWLMLKDRHREALAVLEKTRYADEAETEYTEMQELMRTHHDEKNSFWQLLKLKHYWKPFLIVCVIAILQQLTAINSILQFAAVLLQQSGMSSNLLAMMGATGIMGLNFLTTIVATLLVDKIGRKLLLSLGTFGITCSLFFCAFVLRFMSTGPLQGELLMFGLFAFIIFFAIGPGAVIWMILSELLPLKIRSKGMGIGLFLNSLASAILAAVFMPLIANLGASMVFAGCAFATLIYFLIVWCIVPETKNKTLEEVENLFK